MPLFFVKHFVFWISKTHNLHAGQLLVQQYIEIGGGGRSYQVLDYWTQNCWILCKNSLLSVTSYCYYIWELDETYTYNHKSLSLRVFEMWWMGALILSDWRAPDTVL